MIRIIRNGVSIWREEEEITGWHPSEVADLWLIHNLPRDPPQKSSFTRPKPFDNYLSPITRKALIVVLLIT
jgi:hypothetical protein